MSEVTYMNEKDKIKNQILSEMSAKIDEILESTGNNPGDLYELEKAISRIGYDFEKKALEAIDEYNRKLGKIYSIFPIDVSSVATDTLFVAIFESSILFN